MGGFTLGVTTQEPDTLTPTLAFPCVNELDEAPNRQLPSAVPGVGVHAKEMVVQSMNTVAGPAGIVPLPATTAQTWLPEGSGSGWVTVTV